MTMATNKLTDTGVKALAAPGKYFDGEGLYLEVTAAGSKLWRLKYRLHGKENRFAVGAYPSISLKSARDRAKAARQSIANGVAPLTAKRKATATQRAEQARTFQLVADDFMAHKRNELAQQTLSGYNGALKNHILPTLAKIPVAELTRQHMKDLVGRLEKSPSMAAYALRLAKTILDRAVDDGYVTANVAAGRGILPKRKATSFAAITDPAELKKLLILLDEYKGQGAVMSALRLLTMLPARPSEMATMRWGDVDLDAAEWRYTVSKTGSPHIVPLPVQAVAILKGLQDSRIPSKGEGWVFPSPRNVAAPILPRALLAGLTDRLGYQPGTITTHGFRSTFRTIAHEVLDIDFVVLELMLSHKMPGPLGSTYARAQLLRQRKEAAQKWADYLDSLRVGQ
jgi:integrase